MGEGARGLGRGVIWEGTEQRKEWCKAHTVHKRSRETSETAKEKEAQEARTLSSICRRLFRREANRPETSAQAIKRVLSVAQQKGSVYSVDVSEHLFRSMRWSSCPPF